MSAHAARVRRGVASDARRAGEIARSAYAIYVERIGFEPPPMRANFPALIRAQQLYVLESTGYGICGYCAFWEDGPDLHLSNVAVDPVHQGNGFGASLIAFAENAARERNCAAIALYTNEHMTENQRLYPRLGYREVDRRQEDGVSRVFYRKAITR